MTTPTPRVVFALLTLTLAVTVFSTNLPADDTEAAISLLYLEIVTADVDATCALLEKIHGVSFGDPILEFGNARTAPLTGGGQIGVRAPMRADEEPVVRPYLSVDDMVAAIEAARAAEAEIAIPGMEMPGGHGTFGIYLKGGIQHGLWKLPED